MASPQAVAPAAVAIGLWLTVAAQLSSQQLPGQQGSTCELPRSTPAAEGLSPAAVDSLVARAEKANSDALVLLKNGRLVGEWYFGKDPGPIQTMSATKSVVSMAIGRLLHTGAIGSLDQPVHELYAEWRQGRKSDITLRMLLNHTSGIQNVANAGAEIYPAPDAIKLALAAELSHDPGSYFSYNNKAVNLLSGIVEKAAGVPLDDYVQKEILTPLCIENRFWYKDQAGNPHAMAGLELTPVELARLGQLMLNKGAWGNQRVLSEKWTVESASISQPFSPRAGLLWWLLPQWTRYFIDRPLVESWRKAGVDAEFVDAIQPIIGRSYDSGSAFYVALDSIFGQGKGRAAWEAATVERGILGRRFEAGPIHGYNAEGYLGQYLVILPQEQIVAVRMKRGADDHQREHDFPGFAQLVLELFGSATY